MSMIALPPNWAVFVESVAVGGDPSKVAASLGMDRPSQAAATLLRHPQVRKALAAAALARLEGVTTPLALDTVDEILRDKDAPKAVRAKLALGILDRLVKKQGEAPPLAGKNLGDMTVKELEQLMVQLQGQMADSGLRPGEMLDVTPGNSDSANTNP